MTMTIIPKIDTFSNRPLAFIRESRANGQIQAWDGDKTITVGIDFYNATKPLTDESQLKDVVAAFKRYAKTDDVVVRERLPRTFRPKAEEAEKPVYQRRANDMKAPTVHAAPYVEAPVRDAKPEQPSNVTSIKTKRHRRTQAEMAAARAEGNAKPARKASKMSEIAKRRYEEEVRLTNERQAKYQQEIAKTAAEMAVANPELPVTVPADVKEAAVKKMLLKMAEILMDMDI